MVDITDELFKIMIENNCSPILALIMLKEKENVRKQYDAEHDEHNSTK